jgi:hypothetical protein
MSGESSLRAFGHRDVSIHRLTGLDDRAADGARRGGRLSRLCRRSERCLVVDGVGVSWRELLPSHIGTSSRDQRRCLNPTHSAGWAAGSREREDQFIERSTGHLDVRQRSLAVKGAKPQVKMPPSRRPDLTVAQHVSFAPAGCRTDLHGERAFGRWRDHLAPAPVPDHAACRIPRAHRAEE